MSEIRDLQRQAKPTDKERADRIRTLIMELHATVTKAEDAGLKVELSLHNLGRPTWNGYLDAVKIVRVL